MVQVFIYIHTLCIYVAKTLARLCTVTLIYFSILAPPMKGTTLDKSMVVVIIHNETGLPYAVNGTDPQVEPNKKEHEGVSVAVV